MKQNSSETSSYCMANVGPSEQYKQAVLSMNGSRRWSVIWKEIKPHTKHKNQFEMGSGNGEIAPYKASPLPP